MASKQIVDVHCHLFNLQYAVMELVAATWNNMWGNYPHKRAAIREKGLLETLEGVADFAEWVANLAEVALSDCGHNLDFERNEFHSSSLGGNEFVVVPLMMDIYFSLDDNRDERDVAAPEAFTISDNRRANFNAHFDGIVNLVRNRIVKNIPEAKRKDDKLTEVFESARKELLAPPEKGYEGIELSPGYKKHMHDLEELKGKYPETFFPFLAVDPRRINIRKLIEMKVNRGKGVFKGIKIYPPLGYLPTHPGLDPVYRYCIDHDIPLTLHCSPGGMKNFRKTNYVIDWDGSSHWENFESSKGNKSIYYTAPDKWIRVLDKWPGLRVNFAHFGGGESITANDTVWMESIVEILTKYPNAYADIGFFSKPGLPEMLVDIIRKHPVLTRRLLFGTDYVMVMLDKNFGGLKSYFDRFSGLYPGVLAENARAFLGLK
jgi:predicted TIM-barrel fold metal-dependent hydrolase